MFHARRGDTQQMPGLGAKFARKNSLLAKSARSQTQASLHIA
jgi:hypothetical protein